MALAGVHCAFGYAGVRGVIGGVGVQSTLSLFRINNSETLATAGTTTAVAPAVDPYAGEPVARVTASADSFVSFGASPDASTGARDFIPALETRDFVVKPGDKMAWVAA